MYLCAPKKKKSDMTLSILQPFQANCIHVLHIQVFGSHQIITKMLENSLSLLMISPRKIQFELFVILVHKTIT